MPFLKVAKPTESTLVISSYVTTPVKVAATPVRFLIERSGVPLSPDALTPVRLDPSPKKLVALTTPTTFSFSTGDVELTPTLLSVSTVKTSELPNFDTLRALVIAQLLSSYLGHKKRPPSLLTGGLGVWGANQKI